MSSQGATRRTIRIDDDLWEAAKAQAAADHWTVSDVIREALRAYTSDPDIGTVTDTGAPRG